MRKLLIAMLLAGAAATPALAKPHNDNDRQQTQEDRQQARQDRAQAREDRQQARQDAPADRSAARPSFNPERPAPQVQVRQQAFTGGGQRPDARPNRGNFGGQPQANPYYAPDMTQRQAVRDRMEQRRDQRVDERALRQSNRAAPNVMRNPTRVVSNVPRPGTQPPLRADSYRHGGDHHWDTNWRHDHRYDWRNYRNRHRSLFHLSFYMDPFGWGYQPFSIGYRMWPAYYGNQYWIDPAMYQLPYPPPGAAWVRYFNDAVLVDIYSGTVIDTIPGFFW